LKVAASIFGNPKYINVWRSTDNALETLAFKQIRKLPIKIYFQILFAT
jgi:hypothetical protein